MTSGKHARFSVFLLLKTKYIKKEGVKMSKFVIFKLPVGGLIIPQAFCNCPEYLNDNGTVKSDYWNFAIAAHKQIKFLQKCLETNDKDILVEERSKTQDTVMLELLDILRLRRLHEIMDKAATL
ncbi:MAG TPA: hypothetical protein ENI66_02045, partial [Candidatus Yonathbacteria bacterium]|nr:hypothetical protein [Candidatus Yonathbacteria bacterium]